MQIIESSVWKVRAARFTLTSPIFDVPITLFPMVHVGEPEFFRTVYDDAFSHDVVFVEGIISPVVTRITRSYRWIEHSTTMKLAIQPPYPKQSVSIATIVRADLSPDEFAKIWEQVPLWLRITVYLFVPLVGTWWRCLGTRVRLAEALTLDDLPRREETLSYNPETATLTHAVLDARDAQLMRALSNCIENGKSTGKRIAVVYGALHMRAVLREMHLRYRYRVTQSDWLTIFGY